MDQKLKSEDGSSICHDINISDVIEVIETDDPSFKSDMMDTRISGVEDSPSLRILEQPAPKAVRFRYPCEGRSAGSIPGVNSTPENKSYPTVKIDNYIGRAKIVVSCVTKDQPYRPHPHMIAGRNASSKGVCVVDVDTRTMTAEFPYLGIQCVRRKDVEQMLQQKEENRIDPFGTGFAHRNVLGSLDLNTVRLCFQVFVEGPKEGIYQIPLCPPVVSDPIYDKKALSDLIIVGLSHNSASVAGGQQVILLCEKVSKDDIAVRLFEEKDNNIIWEACCDFNPTDVHKQYAITFRTPPYKTIDIVEPVEVFIQLQRPSDHETSEPRKFTLTPIDAGRPAFWSLRRGNKADYRAFASILQTDMKPLTRIEKVKPAVVTLESVGEESPSAEDANNKQSIEEAKIPGDWPKIDDAYTVLKKNKECVPLQPGNDKDIFELSDDTKNVEDRKLDEVIEITEKMEEEGFNDLLNQVNDIDSICTSDINTENDCGIYTSLQMAMKNPCDFMEFQSQASGYEDVVPPRPTASKPVLPVLENISVNPDHETINQPSKDDELPPLPPKRAKNNPAPSKTPVQEGKSKFNLFTKLFSSNKRKKNKSREGSISSMGSKKSLIISDSKPTENENDVLTEAEHYALYTSLAPHATASEFDEMSFYYSPVEERTNTTDVPVK
ncbi:embryonic polarity protein dorsal-like isoform X1 [Lycorma delicatula]|uniref:embryonic polarity protein dorsal-like isoform X1 n=1 Tax=Lycorma delicatula TaxID=130591 RepID=UPI003F512FCE